MKITSYYNEKRPNQALWNFAPAEVHRVGNKTEFRKHLHEMKGRAKLEKKICWTQWNQPVSNKRHLSFYPRICLTVIKNSTFNWLHLVQVSGGNKKTERNGNG